MRVSKKINNIADDNWDDSNTSAEDFFCLAELAQQEPLKEKMKKILEDRQGDKMDEIAALAVDALIAFENGVNGPEASRKYKSGLLRVLKES